MTRVGRGVTTGTIRGRYGRAGINGDSTADVGHVAALAVSASQSAVSSPNQYQDVGRVSRPLS